MLLFTKTFFTARLGAALAGCLAFAAATAFSTLTLHAEPLVLPVWSGTPPGETAPPKPEKITRDEDGVVTSMTDIWTPTVEFHAAPAGLNTGAAVLVCPGGAYIGLAYDHEGTQVARWFNSIGVNTFILRYRVPRRPKSLFGEIQRMDAQRALSLIRARAAEWKIDPARVGIMGFSAGGHLSAITSIAPGRTYAAADETDTFSCRPDFTILVYPAYMVEKGKNRLEARVTPGKGAPPAICVHSANDQYTSDGSLLYFRALRRQKVVAGLHIYSTGGHGWGMRGDGEPAETWNTDVAAWLKAGNWLKR